MLAECVQHRHQWIILLLLRPARSCHRSTDVMKGSRGTARQRREPNCSHPLIPPREMRSNAPMPSIDRTMARSSNSSACAIHSAPLVVRAYWNGAVARSTAVANCWEIVRATNRRILSRPRMAFAMLPIVRDAPHPQSRQAPLLWRSFAPTAKTALCPPHSPEADVNDQSSCLKVPRLRPSWPPSSSSRICRGPDRTMLLLVEKGGLAKAPEAQEAASLDPGGLAMWHQILAPTTLPPEDHVQMTAHPIAQVLPNDRHIVGGRPRVSDLVVCPLTTFHKEVGPSSFSKITEPLDQPALWCLTTPRRFVQQESWQQQEQLPRPFCRPVIPGCTCSVNLNECEPHGCLY